MFKQVCDIVWVIVIRPDTEKLSEENIRRTLFDISCRIIVIRPDTEKLSEENICRTLFDISCSKIFLDPPPREITIKTKINGT